MDDSLFIGRKRLMVTGDKLLVSPLQEGERTHTGLYLPDSAVDGKKVAGGWVEAVGPGYPVASASSVEEEPWKPVPARREQYIPLPAAKGDYAMYVRSSAFELALEGRKYFVVPFSAVLALLREDWPAPIPGAEHEEA